MDNEQSSSNLFFLKYGDGMSVPIRYSDAGKITYGDVIDLVKTLISNVHDRLEVLRDIATGDLANVNQEEFELINVMREHTYNLELLIKHFQFISRPRHNMPI